MKHLILKGITNDLIQFIPNYLHNYNIIDWIIIKHRDNTLEMRVEVKE